MKTIKLLNIISIVGFIISTIFFGDAYYNTNIDDNPIKFLVVISATFSSVICFFYALARTISQKEVWWLVSFFVIGFTYILYIILLEPELNINETLKT